jgi:hypothetical protein
VLLHPRVGQSWSCHGVLRTGRKPDAFGPRPTPVGVVVAKPQRAQPSHLIIP